MAAWRGEKKSFRDKSYLRERFFYASRLTNYNCEQEHICAREPEEPKPPSMEQPRDLVGTLHHAFA